MEALGKLGAAPGVTSSVALVALFPSLSSLFAAAEAAATLALEYDDEKDPVLRPFRGVAELVRLTASTGWNSFKKTRLAKSLILPVWSRMKGTFKR